MLHTFQSYLISRRIGAETIVDLRTTYSNYLFWLVSRTHYYSVSDILFQLKIINDLIVYNLSPSNNQQEEREKLLLQYDSDLIKKIYDTLTQTVNKWRDEMELGLLPSILGTILCIAALFLMSSTPLFLVSSLALGLGLTPVSALMLRNFTSLRGEAINWRVKLTAFATVAAGMIVMTVFEASPVIWLAAAFIVAGTTCLSAFRVHEASIPASKLNDRCAQELTNDLLHTVDPEAKHISELQEPLSSTISCFVRSYELYGRPNETISTFELAQNFKYVCLTHKQKKI